MTYVDAYVIPVPRAKREAYEALAAMATPIFIEHGAIEVQENWMDDVPHGVTTDFFMAVKAEEDEDIVMSWIIWPSREARDAGNASAMADKRFESVSTLDIFDGKRMIFGGFSSIVHVKG